MRNLFAALAAVAVVAAAPPPAPLQPAIVADAKAFGPATLAFERTTRTTATDGKETKVETRVDRWDGKMWTLVSIDGKPVLPEASAKWNRDRAGKPVPGYHRLAQFLAAPARQTVDAASTTMLALDALPRGSIDMSGDRSDQFAAEAIVDTSTTRPWVRRFHAHARGPFRIMIVGKIDRFDLVNDYALDATGHPALVRQVQDYAGSGPGQSGSLRSESSFRALR